MRSDPAETGRAVEHRRKQLGWSQERLAAEAGTTRATVDGVEKGRTKTPYKLPDIFRALGWPPDGPASADDERELAEIKDRLRGSGLSQKDMDIAARAIQAGWRNMADPASRNTPGAVGE